MENCKFLTTHKNAPSWNTRMDFDHEIAIARNHIFLSVFPKVAVDKDNQCAIILDCFGLRYKHMDKFAITIVEGECSKIETNLLPLGNLTGKEMFRRFVIPLTSSKGILKVTDTFLSQELRWEITQDQILVSHQDYQVLIHFEQGVIDIPNHRSNKMMIDFLNLCKTTTTSLEDLASLDRQIAKYTQRNSIN
jgi:hypothetical protein